MAANYYVIVPGQLGVPSPVSATGTSQLFPLGFRAGAVDLQTGSKTSSAVGTRAPGAEFVYVKGSAASRGAAVIFNDVGQVKQASTAHTGSCWQMGIAAGAISATNVYGWVQIRGYCDYAVGTDSSIAAGAQLYLGSTAGVLESRNTDSNGYQIMCIVPIVSHSATADEPITCYLNIPAHVGVTANL